MKDVVLRGPADYETVLTQMYGDYRNPPSKDEMNHHNTRIKEGRADGRIFCSDVCLSKGKSCFFRSIESMMKQRLPFSDFVLVWTDLLERRVEGSDSVGRGKSKGPFSVCPSSGKQGAWKGACRRDYAL